MSLEDIEKRKKAINKQSSQIGLFVIHFERVSQLIRYCILNTCYPNASREEQVKIGILTEDLTVYPLIKAFNALIGEFHPEIKDEYGKIRKLFTNLNEIRNKLLHGNYSLGVKYHSKGFDVENDSLIFKKPSTTNSGFNDQPYNFGIESLEILVRRAMLLEHSYGLLDCYIAEKSTNNPNDEALNAYKEGLTKSVVDIVSLELSSLIKE